MTEGQVGGVWSVGGVNFKLFTIPLLEWEFVLPPSETVTDVSPEFLAYSSIFLVQHCKKSYKS
jgi:hypothetical protein